MAKRILMNTEDVRFILVENYSNFSSTPRHPQYSQEADRLASFDGWSVSYARSEDTFKSGFFYTGVRDIVICHHCGLTACNFKGPINPASHHLKYQPNCLFLREKFFPISTLN